MKKVSTLLGIVFISAPLSAFALVTNTSASAVSSGGGDASAAVQTTVTGSGTYRTEIRTEENGVAHTEVQEGKVPPGARVEIHIATSTPSVRIDERLKSANEVRAGEARELTATSSSAEEEAWPGMTNTFIAALWRGFAKIFSIFGF